MFGDDLCRCTFMLSLIEKLLHAIVMEKGKQSEFTCSVYISSILLLLEVEAK